MTWDGLEAKVDASFIVGYYREVQLILCRPDIVWRKKYCEDSSVNEVSNAQQMILRRKTHQLQV